MLQGLIQKKKSKCESLLKANMKRVKVLMCERTKGYSMGRNIFNAKEVAGSRNTGSLVELNKHHVSFKLLLLSWLYECQPAYCWILINLACWIPLKHKSAATAFANITWQMWIHTIVVDVACEPLFFTWGGNAKKEKINASLRCNGVGIGFAFVWNNFFIQ